MTSSRDLFLHDREQEIMHFIEEMGKEYTNKCTPEQWNTILRAVGRRVSTMEFNRRMGPQLGSAIKDKSNG